MSAPDWSVVADDERTVNQAAERAGCEGGWIIVHLDEIGYRRLGHAPGERADGLILIRESDLDRWWQS